MSLENRGAVKIIDTGGDAVNVSPTGNLMVDIGAASISGDLSVNLTTDDKVSVYGNTHAGGGGNSTALLTDLSGHLQVDVLTAPETAVTIAAAVEVVQDTVGDLNATVDCNGSYVKLKAEDGTALTDGSNSGMLDVTIHSNDGSAITDSAGKMNVHVGNTTGSPVYTQSNITGMVSEINDDGDAGPEDLRAAGDTACKRVDMMADPANTGHIWVGDASVVNDGTGGGIRLGAGDFYSIDVDMVNDIHLAATAANQKIMYTYYT